MIRSTLCFGFTDMTASFQEGRILAFLSIQLKYSNSKEETSSLKILYHSFGNPLLPGLLFVFSLLIALSSFSFVIGVVRASFKLLPMEGRSSFIKIYILRWRVQCFIVLFKGFLNHIWLVYYFIANWFSDFVH